jgi:KaiC/GvpD/RAD55 family RecA-like ATPase|tara:strand:- start:2705 stop:4114 length:1410 start_codon:yes stop_codon:yes gene_type:complete
VNLEGVTIKLLLTEENKELALSSYSELKPDYFSNTFKAVLRHIKEFYDTNGGIPSLKELEVFRSRDRKTLSAISSISLIDTQDIDIRVAIEELANQSAQNITLDMLDVLLQDISLLGRHELLDKLAYLPIQLEETLTTSEVIYTAKSLSVFKRPDALAKARMLCGICNAWDYEAGGYYRQEFVLLGGKRGAGKSVFCANLVAQQHRQGNVSIYATIEMTAEECWHRIMCVLAQVEFSKLRKDQLTDEDNVKLARTMASLFIGGDEVFEKHFVQNTSPNVFDFQDELQRTCKEKDEGRIIILDDRDLTIATLDVKVSSYKSRYGDLLTLVVVDYINQLILEPGADPYDWKTQTTLGKLLKNQARKNDICLVSPYQMDDNGIARFAKGILDAADLAQLINIIDKETGVMALETTKARSTKDDGKYGLRMDWKTLTIDPTEIDLEAMDGSEQEETSTPTPKKEQLSEGDLII